MNIGSQNHRIELLLKQHQVLRVDETRPRMTIECKDGIIWVTNSGESQDYMLRRGRRYVPRTHGSIVIEAVNDACVDIEEE